MLLEPEQRPRVRAAAWSILCWVGVVVAGLAAAALVFVAGALLGLVK